MAIEITCPNGHLLRLAEKYAGKNVRCPKCQTVLQIPSIAELGGASENAEPIAPERRDEFDDDEAERKAERRRDRRERLNQVRTGITLHLIKIISALLLVILIGVLGGVAAGTKSVHMGRVIDLGANGARIAISVLGIVGSILCMSVPRASGARNMITVSLCLDLTMIGLNTILLIIPINGLLLIGVGISQMLLWMGAWLTFMFFLKNLADYLRKRFLEDDTLSVIKLGLILWGLGIVMPLVAGVVVVLGCVGVLIAFGIAIALLVMGIIFLIKYVKLLLAFREAM